MRDHFSHGRILRPGPGRGPVSVPFLLPLTKYLPSLPRSLSAPTDHSCPVSKRNIAVRDERASLWRQRCGGSRRALSVFPQVGRSRVDESEETFLVCPVLRLRCGLIRPWPRTQHILRRFRAFREEDGELSHGRMNAFFRSLFSYCAVFHHCRGLDIGCVNYQEQTHYTGWQLIYEQFFSKALGSIHGSGRAKSLLGQRDFFRN